MDDGLDSSAAGSPGQPTLNAPGTQRYNQAQRGRLVRRLVVAALAAFVGTALLGGFGYRQRTLATSSGGIDVELSYPAVTRGGLPARWSIELRRADGAALPAVEMRTTASYFALFDHHDLAPEPDDSWYGDGALHWRFEPAGHYSELVIELDVRTQPTARWRYPAETVVVVGGATVARFGYRTTVMP